MIDNTYNYINNYGLASAGPEMALNTASAAAKLIGPQSSNISLISYQVWYLRWIFPTLSSLFKCNVFSSVNPLEILNIFGFIGYMTKLYNNSQIISKSLSKSEYTNLQGEQYEERRFRKAIPRLYDTVITVPTLILYFGLHLACSPLFIATAIGFFASSAYSFIKNAKNLVSFNSKAKEQQEYIESLPEFLQEKHQKVLVKEHARHKAKLKRSTFDLTFMAASIVATVFFCIMPFIGATALLAIGFTYYFGRKNFTAKAVQTKQEAITANKSLMLTEKKIKSAKAKLKSQSKLEQKASGTCKVDAAPKETTETAPTLLKSPQINPWIFSISNSKNKKEKLIPSRDNSTRVTIPRITVSQL